VLGESPPINDVWPVTLVLSSVVDALYALVRPYSTCEVPAWSVLHVTVAPVSVGDVIMLEITGGVVPTAACTRVASSAKPLMSIAAAMMPAKNRKYRVSKVVSEFIIFFYLINNNSNRMELKLIVRL